MSRDSSQKHCVVPFISEELGDNPDTQIKELYQGRAAIEKEYATKLQSLTKRAADKKARMEVRYIVGEDPTKAWDNSTLKRR